jgi:hypothetical protein
VKATAQKSWRKHIVKRRAENAVWRLENPDKVRANNRKHFLLRDKEAERERGWRRNGIDVASARKVFDAAKRCAICGLTGARLRIDHDHATGKTREALCDRCNVMIGMAQDLPARLRAGAEYLERHAGLYPDAWSVV